jgi:hypothetical protein
MERVKRGKNEREGEREDWNEDSHFYMGWGMRIF